MNPATEQAVADALPHRYLCPASPLNSEHGLCDCGANKRRNVLLAKLSTQNGYVYLDRRH